MVGRAGALVEELVSSAVAQYGVQMAIEHIRGVPPVVNAPEAVDLLTDAAKRVGVDPVPPGGPTFDLHQGDLVVDEASVTHGARVLTAAVLSRRLPGGVAVGDVPSR